MSAPWDNDSEEYSNEEKIDRAPNRKVKIKIAEDPYEEPSEDGIIQDLDEKEEELDNFSKSALRSNGVFKINNRQVMLTYKTHLDKEDYRSFVDELAPFDELFIAHENADLKNPYKHTHAYIKFTIPFVSSDSRVFDWDVSETQNIHPHISVLGAKKVDEIKMKYYISKEDKSPDLAMLRVSCDDWNKANGNKARLGKGLADDQVSLLERVCSYKTYQEMLKHLCKEPGHATGLRELWESKLIAEKPKIKFSEIAEFTWQKTMRDKLLAPEWNHRILTYIVDKKGGSGKSTFADYMVNTYNALYLSSVTSSRDIATLIDEHLKCGGSAKYIILDLPRASKAHKMWDTVEALLNGKLTVGKWKGKPLHFDKPRLIVFANFAPPLPGDESRAADVCEDNCVLSPDRWDIWDIVCLDAAKAHDGEHDRIMVNRANPHRDLNWVKPKRFQNLDY
ncbi:putative replication protein [Chimeric virus 14]|uniref:putative replication protein n=1 Tax=Chimeric virus 14 TaxID=1608440 RepID=UPI0005B5765D|nr:putative replication protein [Chimeric virus 14]AJK30618.1 putative replication protein [Chimeric virus 14]